jgi:protease-4
VQLSVVYRRIRISVTREEEDMGLKRIVVGTLALLGTFVFLLAAAAVVVLVFLPKVEQAVPDKVIIKLDLERNLVEYQPGDTISKFIEEKTPTVLQTVEALEKASEDPRVLGLVAKIGESGMGLAKIQEIRNAVSAFRKHGKPTVAYSETFGEFGPGTGAYYLATAFDTICLQPSGDIGLTGLIFKSPFVLGTLEKLGITASLDKRGKYKSAVDIFTHRKFTDAQKEATISIMNSQFNQITKGIADTRGISESEVKALINQGPFSAQEGFNLKLVDKLAYRDEVYDAIKSNTSKEAKFLSLRKYWQSVKNQEEGKVIALIYCVGAIHRGKSEAAALAGVSAGSDTLSAAFRSAMEDKSVKAILFRIDSPGGSYVASDTIWHETRGRGKKASKPVIVSMGDVAASGGYFVAASATKIVAQPGTLTGSIGVFAGKAVITDFWSKLGVTWDEVHTSDNSTFWSSTDNYTPEQWNRFENWLDLVYRDFTTKVAEGRKLPIQKVLDAAQGRVWTGEEAKGLGLVDELGGFPEALRLAREAAGIPPEAAVQLKLFPRTKTLLETIVDRLFGKEGEEESPSKISLYLRQASEYAKPLAYLVKILASADYSGPNLRSSDHGEGTPLDIP